MNKLNVTSLTHSLCDSVQSFQLILSMFVYLYLVLAGLRVVHVCLCLSMSLSIQISRTHFLLLSPELFSLLIKLGMHSSF